MQKLVTAILTAVVGLIAYPSLPEPTPSQLVSARWVKFERQKLFDQIEMLIALQSKQPTNAK
ncbi:MAG: hypothetical protein R3D62_00455 [Xanthobacteraceae bacterium]